MKRELSLFFFNTHYSRILFQSGHPFLSLAYGKASPYPFASSIAQEIFQSGLIPSDTDFRIYRDFGKLPGLDFAYVENGYVYHTILDDLDRLQPGCIQRFGENLQNTIRYINRNYDSLLCLNTSVETTAIADKYVFFDILGLYMVLFSATWSKYWSILLVITALMYSIIFGNLRSIQCIIKSILCCLFFSMAVGFLLRLLHPMSWYSSPGLAIILFGSIAVLGYIIPITDSLLAFRTKQILKYSKDEKIESKKEIFVLENEMLIAMLLPWIVCNLLLLSYQKTSSYLMNFWIVFPLCGRLLLNTISISSITLVLTLQNINLILKFFIPLMGRLGTKIPSDIVIAAIIGVSVVMLATGSFQLIIFISNNNLRRMKYALCLICAVSIVIAITRNPYSPTTPKRLSLHHMQRNTKNNQTFRFRDSGLWIVPWDYNGVVPLKSILQDFYGKDRLLRRPELLDNHHGIYGDMPYSCHTKIAPAVDTLYIPTPFPRLEASNEILIFNTTFQQLDDDIRLFYFDLTGPSHMRMAIYGKDCTLLSWNINNVILEDIKMQEPHTYLFQFITGKQPGRYKGNIKIKSSHRIDVAVWANYIHAELTDDLNDLMKYLPSWVTPTPMISLWEMQTIE